MAPDPTTDEVKKAERAFQDLVVQFLVDHAEAGKLTVEDAWALEERPEYWHALARLGRANLAQAVYATVMMGLFREDENADLVSCLGRKAG
jgi:hypothetical protein